MCHSSLNHSSKTITVVGGPHSSVSPPVPANLKLWSVVLQHIVYSRDCFGVHLQYAPPWKANANGSLFPGYVRGA